MTYLDKLRKAIEALKRIKDADVIYADCLFHLESELRRLQKQPKQVGNDFFNYPADGWKNNKNK